MALSTQPYKGARDFYPEDKRLQKYMFNMMRAVCEWYGYEEYDAPILEPTGLYASKTSDEIVSEQTYTFEDRGGRSVTLRTEMTPSVSRMVAGKRQELAYPVRWYSIPSNWRYERPQRGRLREFWQLNVDLFGIASEAAELEMIQVADTVLQAFGANREMYTIRLNSRKLMDYLFTEYLGLKKEQIPQAMRLIDKQKKIKAAEFESLFSEMIGKDRASKLLGLLKADSFEQLPDELRAIEPAKRLQTTLDDLKKLGITNIEFDITVARGFDYYTDLVFEVFDTDPENNRSMFGGGRYDGLVGLFGVEPVPTVGFAMGDVTLQNFLESHKLLPELPVETDVYVLLAGDVFMEAQPAINGLRQNRLRVAVDSSGRKLPAQLKAASKRGIKHVVIIGEKELTEQKYVLKDMRTGTEEVLAVDEIAKKVAGS